MHDPGESTAHKQGQLNYVLFPEPLYHLRCEIENHPELKLRLSEQDNKDIYIQISEIAAYCGIIVNGTYTRDQIMGMIDVLIWELKKKSSILILP